MTVDDSGRVPAAKGLRAARHGAAGAAGFTALAAAAVLLLAACGGGGKSGASATTTSAPTTTTAGNAASGNAAFQAYRQCLQQHGVTLPAGFGDRGPGRFGGGGPGTTGTGGSSSSGPPRSFTPPSTTPAEAAAQKACASKLPAGGFRGGAGGANAQALTVYTSCLRDHGISIPATGSGQGGGLRNIDRTSAKFQAANKICAPLLPSGFQFGGGNRGNGGNGGSTTAVPTTGASA